MTSLVVNISIKRNFELYIDNNIREAGNSIVTIVQDFYEQGSLDDKMTQETVVENYMGNFAISLFSPQKKLICGITEEQFLEELKARGKTSIQKSLYREEERPARATRLILKMRLFMLLHNRKTVLHS